MRARGASITKSCTVMWRGSLRGCGAIWVGSRCRMRGRRSGIRVATGCMCTSRSAATSVDANGNNLTAIAPNGTTTNSYDALNPFGAAWGGIRL